MRTCRQKKKRGTLFWLWFFKSINFLSVRQRCSADVDSFTVMREGGGQAGGVGWCPIRVASISNKMASALPQISTFFFFFFFLTHLGLERHECATSSKAHIDVTVAHAEMIHSNIFPLCTRHPCVHRQDGLKGTFSYTCLGSHTHTFSYILCLSINNTDSFGLVDRICNGVCIASSSDWPGDSPLDWLFLSNW